MSEALLSGPNSMLIQAEHLSVHNLLTGRTLILASKRGLVTLQQNEQDGLEYYRGSGGLVTAWAGI